MVRPTDSDWQTVERDGKVFVQIDDPLAIADWAMDHDWSWHTFWWIAEGDEQERRWLSLQLAELNIYLNGRRRAGGSVEGDWTVHEIARRVAVIAEACPVVLDVGGYVYRKPTEIEFAITLAEMARDGEILRVGVSKNGLSIYQAASQNDATPESPGATQSTSVDSGAA